MDELIRRAVQQDASRCQVRAVPWDSIRDRLLDDAVPSMPVRQSTIRRKIAYGLTAIIVIGGLLIMSGFISPVMAEILERVPAIDSAYKMFAECLGLQDAIIKEFGAKVNQTATDKGITVTVTDALYDQGRLDIGYTVTASRPDAYPPIPVMQFLINGKTIHDTTQGTGEKIGSGWIGFEEIYPRGDLPETFDLQISIRQIGDRLGKWLLTVPVSRQRTDAATRVILPMKAVMAGQATVTVTKVMIGPSSTTIDYDVNQDLNQSDKGELLDFAVEDDQGHGLSPTEGGPISHQVEGHMETWALRAVYVSPESMPKYLVLTPVPPNFKDHLDQAAKIKVFLN